MHHTHTYDLIGIGIGPFNLGLAALCEPVQELSTLFLEQSDSFDWHPGLMLDEATLQVPFMADLVTMADPTSPYSFLNFMKESGRIYKFYIRENFFVLRREYNAYCQWVAGRLGNCRFSRRVVQLRHEEDRYIVNVANTQTNTTETYYTRKLVLGTGTQPYIPHTVARHGFEKVIHTSDYLHRKQELLSERSITIVGSGQSAAEVFRDLLPETRKGLHINWLTRSERFFPLENHTRLTLEFTSPEYVDYFHALPDARREQVLAKQHPLYKGINYDLINDIYDQLYAMELADGKTHVTLMANSRLDDISWDGAAYQLYFTQAEQGQTFDISTQYVIMATGYKYREPAFLEGIGHLLKRRPDGSFDVHRQYTIDVHDEDIYVQNAELHTHGFAAPDLGMGAYRNAIILNRIAGRELYKVETRIAYQHFDAAAFKAENPVPVCDSLL